MNKLGFRKFNGGVTVLDLKVGDKSYSCNRWNGKSGVECAPNESWNIIEKVKDSLQNIKNDGSHSEYGFISSSDFLIHEELTKQLLDTGEWDETVCYGGYPKKWGKKDE